MTYFLVETPTSRERGLNNVFGSVHFLLSFSIESESFNEIPNDINDLKSELQTSYNILFCLEKVKLLFKIYNISSCKKY